MVLSPRGGWLLFLIATDSRAIRVSIPTAVGTSRSRRIHFNRSIFGVILQCTIGRSADIVVVYPHPRRRVTHRRRGSTLRRRRRSVSFAYCVVVLINRRTKIRKFFAHAGGYASVILYSEDKNKQKKKKKTE